MNIRIFPAQHLPKELIVRWAEIQRENMELSSPFFSPEFMQAVASVRSDAFIAVVNDGKAFFPFQRSRLGFGKPIGGPISDYHGLISSADYECDGRALISACNLLAWDFDHVPKRQKTFAPWHTAEAASYVLDIYSDRSLFSKDTNVRHMTNKRRLERDFGAIDFQIDENSERMLQLCREWKSSQYSQSGLFDVFQVPWIRQLTELIARSHTPDFAGVTSTLYAGGRPIAVHFGMRSKRVWHYWFPAYDREFRRYSPGILLLIHMISGAKALGVSTIDFGKGEEEYKKQLSNRTVPLIEGSITASRLVATLRQGQTDLRNLGQRGPLMQFVPDRMKRLIRQMRRQGRFG